MRVVDETEGSCKMVITSIINKVRLDGERPLAHG